MKKVPTLTEGLFVMGTSFLIGMANLLIYAFSSNIFIPIMFLIYGVCALSVSGAYAWLYMLKLKKGGISNYKSLLIFSSILIMLLPAFIAGIFTGILRR